MSAATKKPEEVMEVDNVAVEPSKDKEDKKSEKDVDLLTIEDIREHCRCIERGESSKEPRYVVRVLRSLITTRKKLNTNVLQKLISIYFANPNVAKQKDVLLKLLESDEASTGAEPMELDKPAVSAQPPRSPKPKRPSSATPAALLPEVEVYIHLLVVLLLIDKKKYKLAESCIDSIIDRIQNQNRRTLDPLSAKAYYYYAYIYEKNGKLSSIRSFLHTRLRMATLRHDDDGQATLINCLLRSYLTDNLFDLAGRLVTKVTFPEPANNNEWARYLYYLACIKAMQLDYSAAHKNLLQALRKSPQHTGAGFKQSVQKLTVVIELLLGEIPDRSIFRQPIYRKALLPYFQLTQAVRTGAVEHFDKVLVQYGPTFHNDNTHSLIVRLRQNVIKTAVKQISLAYSRISIEDAQKKLQLSHPDVAEYVVSKCIRDGNIDAVLNHQEGYVYSKETIDVYGTTEPQQQFHNRILFCLEIFNQSVKAMRFPPKSYNKDLESAEERREREQQDLEFAKEMAEEDDDFP